MMHILKEQVNYSETMRSEALTAQPTSVEELCSELLAARTKGLKITIQGGALSYGDSAMPVDGSLVVNLTKLNQILSLDVGSRRIRVQTGVQLGEILCKALPNRLLLPVFPGDHQVTVGGAIANNVHGKWSWRYGNFGSHVHSMRILKANGELVNASASENAELFHAVISGIGGLAIVVEAELNLVSIPSPYISVETVTVPCIEDSLKVLCESRDDCDLFLAWCDMFARGQRLGRGFVERSRWDLEKTECSEDEVRASLYGKRLFLSVFPFPLIWTMLRPFYGRRLVRWLNAGLYWAAWLRSFRAIPKGVMVTDFLTIHKRLPNMRSVYRPHGYYEFQPMIPLKAQPIAVRELIEMCQRHRCESLLCGIKIHQQDDFMLSYCGDGFSVGIDVHAGEFSHMEIEAFANELTQHAVKHGGRLFLAKDQWVKSADMPLLFGRFAEYLELKKKYDPDYLFETRQTARLIRPHFVAAMAAAKVSLAPGL